MAKIKDDPAQKMSPLKCLEKLGVHFTYQAIWEGEPPNRTRRPDTANITSVRLPFTKTEWWNMATSNGTHYIGPCCGTTGAMQDIICHVHRFNQTLSAHDFLRLADLAHEHEGFELWHKPLSKSALHNQIKNYAKLNPWDKLGIIYQACKSKLHDNKVMGTMPSMRTAKPEEPPEKEACWRLYRAMQYFAHADLFPSTDKKKESVEKQRHANDLLAYARTLPLLQTVTRIMHRKFEPFEGFAIVKTEKTDYVVENELGLCIYGPKERAQAMIDRWAQDAPELAGKLRIRPVRITVKDGIVFTDNQET